MKTSFFIGLTSFFIACWIPVLFQWIYEKMEWSGGQVHGVIASAILTTVFFVGFGIFNMNIVAVMYKDLENEPEEEEDK